MKPTASQDDLNPLNVACNSHSAPPVPFDKKAPTLPSTHTAPTLCSIVARLRKSTDPIYPIIHGSCKTLNMLLKIIKVPKSNAHENTSTSSI